MNAAWKTVRVFISSTFRDMHAERDHLVRFVFPKLRQELLQRRIHLVDVDLRWGVTSEQDALSVCREVVDVCRPRFLCMLGGRYGWVPPGKTRSITADEVHYGVLDRDLASRGFAYFYFRDTSATMAMVEAAPGEFREPAGSHGADALAQLKTAIAKSGLQPFIYPAHWDDQSRRLIGLKEFGDRVYADLKQSIDQEFGPTTGETPDEFTEENAAMEAFIEERVQRFVLGSRESVLNELLAHASATGGNGYVCLTGVAGSGKSALLAHLYRHLTAPLPPPDSAICNPQSTIVIPHFVGASPGSTDVRRTLRRLCHELVTGAALTAEIPEDPEKLRVAFAEILQQTSAQKRVVILLDAINQFDPTTQLAGWSWLPEELPAAARIILSTAVEPRNTRNTRNEGQDVVGRVPPLGETTPATSGDVAYNALHHRRIPPREIELGPLTAEDREAIIREFLHRYRKSMTDDQRAALLAKADAGTPLYLLVALEELRTLGTYEEITDRIAQLPPDTRALFIWILKRLDDDDGFRDASGQKIGRELVSRFVSLMGVSRHGLSQQELVELLSPGDPQGNVAALTQLLRPYLMQRGELLDFYHGQFREAVGQAYLAGVDEKLKAHTELAEYFHAQDYWRESLEGQRQRAKRLPPTPRPANVRKMEELPWQRLQSQQWNELEQLLTDLFFLEAKAEAGMVFELAGDFSKTVAALPSERPERRILRLLEEALRRDIHFIARHPTTLFQCIWNTCWWHERPEATELDTFVRRWQDEKQFQTPGFRWLLLEKATRSSNLHHHIIPFEGESVAVSISADGRRIAVCSAERVRLIDRPFVEEMLRIPADIGFRYSTIALSAEGSLLGFAQWSKEAGAVCLVLDTDQGCQSPAFHVPDGEMLSVVFASDGKKLAACGVSSRAGWLGVVDLRNNEWVWKHAIPGRLMRKVIFSHDDAGVIAAGGDGVCTIWSTASGVKLKDIHCHADGVSDISLSPSGDSLLSVGKDGTCRIWPTGRCGNGVSVKTVLDSPSDSPLVAGTFLDDSSIAVADFAGNVFHLFLSGPSTPVKILGCGRGTVRLASANKGALLMIAASGDQQCHMVDVAEALDVGGFKSLQAQAVDYTHAGRTVTVTEHAGHIRSFDIAGPDWKQQASRRPVSLDKPIAASAVSSSRFHLLVAHDGQWWLRDTVDGTDARGQFNARMEAGSVVSVSPDGRIICAFVREKLEFAFRGTGKRKTFSLPMIACAIRLSDDGIALVLGHGCRFNKLWPRDVIAIWFNPHVANAHRIAGPFGSELAAGSLDVLVSEDDIFMTSRTTTGGCVVNLWNLMTLAQTAERRFSEPVRLMCLRSDCKQAAVYVPTLSVCHIVDTTTPRLDDRWVLPVANALAVVSIRPGGDLVTTCDQQGVVSMFRVIGPSSTSAPKERIHLCSDS